MPLTCAFRRYATFCATPAVFHAIFAFCRLYADAAAVTFIAEIDILRLPCRRHYAYVTRAKMPQRERRAILRLPASYAADSRQHEH